MGLGKRLLLLCVFLGAASGGVYAAHARMVPSGIPAGIRVDGEPITGELRAFVQARADALLERKVKVVLESAASDGVSDRTLRELTFRELGVSVDVDAVVRRVSAQAAGDILTRADRQERARAGEIDVPLLPVVDPSAVFVLFSDLKEEEDLAPVAARMDLDHREIVSEKDGRYVDLDGAAANVHKAALDPEARVVMIPRAAFKPLVTRASLSKIDIHEVVASFETKFGRAGGAANRARNIEVAAARLNGLVIPGGGTISFNGVVGARSEENGFKHAPEIFKGEMIDGVGGGTCQVASTFHAAAMYAGLDVLERLPHSRPSGYIPMGFDATVVYPSVDLKIRNPFPFALVVHAWVEDTRLKMELLGEKKQVEVTIGNTVVGSAPYTRKIVEEAGLEKPVTKQKGIRGYHIKRSRVIAFSNGEKRVETSMDIYPPTTEIYRVPAGYDATELPPLPEDEKKQDG